MARINIGKLPEVPFRRSIPSNPLEPEYKYDVKTEQTFGFNSSTNGLRGTQKRAAGYEAGPDTRPLLSSIRAISDTKTHRKHPLIPHNTP